MYRRSLFSIYEVHLCGPAPGGGTVFARRPLGLAVAMPKEGEYTWLVDLNKDGKQDILMHHPSTSGPHRLTILIAR